MTPVPGGVERARLEAERTFLGRPLVVGIGIGGEQGSGLVFLVQQASADIEAAIRDWGTRTGVSVEVKVVGDLAPLG